MVLRDDATEDRRGIINVPLSHAYGCMSLLVLLAYGMSAVIMNKFVPDVYLGAIQKYRVTSLMVVPPLALFLAQYPLLAKYDLSSVEYIYCGVAALAKDVEETLRKK